MVKTIHQCDQCPKSYKTRAGLWKHKKAKHIVVEDRDSRGDSLTPEDGVQTSESGDILQSNGGEESSQDFNPPNSPPEDTSNEWLDWTFSEPDSTDALPLGLKSIVSGPQMSNSKMSKGQREALEKQNHAILKYGLTFIDLALTKYGSKVSEDPNFIVSHDENTKELVANAQYRYLEEKGIFLTNHLSTGMIAAGLTAFYIGQPIIRIRKHAKRRFFKTRILSRLPLIGRFFKSKEVDTTELAQNTVVVE